MSFRLVPKSVTLNDLERRYGRYLVLFVCMYVSFGQGYSLLWTHMLRPFHSRPVALTQEGRSLVNDVCECVRD